MCHLAEFGLNNDVSVYTSLPLHLVRKGRTHCQLKLLWFASGGKGNLEPAVKIPASRGNVQSPWLHYVYLSTSPVKQNKPFPVFWWYLGFVFCVAVVLMFWPCFVALLVSLICLYCWWNPCCPVMLEGLGQLHQPSGLQQLPRRRCFFSRQQDPE